MANNSDHSTTSSQSEGTTGLHNKRQRHEVGEDLDFNFEHFAARTQSATIMDSAIPHTRPLSPLIAPEDLQSMVSSSTIRTITEGAEHVLINANQKTNNTSMVAGDATADDEWLAVLTPVQDEHETSEEYAFNKIDDGPQPDLSWVLDQNSDRAKQERQQALRDQAEALRVRILKGLGGMGGLQIVDGGELEKQAGGEGTRQFSGYPKPWPNPEVIGYNEAMKIEGVTTGIVGHSAWGPGQVLYRLHGRKHH